MPRDLTTLAAIKKMIGGEADTTSTYDTILSTLNTQASEMLHREARREFVGPAAVEIRKFHVDRPTREDRELLVGDMKNMGADLVSVKIYRRADNTLLETCDLSMIVGLPEIREAWQPVTSLWFIPGGATSAALELGARVEVEAKWGFPAIPDDVVKIATQQAAFWFQRDYADRNSQQFTRTDRYDLDIGVRFAIRRYRAPRA